MLADQNPASKWSREGGPFDIIAIAVSVIVIVGGVLIVNASSQRYRSAGTPVVSAPPVVVPLVVPGAKAVPRQ